jgi:hypothetical protein
MRLLSMTKRGSKEDGPPQKTEDRGLAKDRGVDAREVTSRLPVF